MLNSFLMIIFIMKSIKSTHKIHNNMNGKRKFDETFQNSQILLDNEIYTSEQTLYGVQDASLSEKTTFDSNLLTHEYKEQNFTENVVENIHSTIFNNSSYSENKRLKSNSPSEKMLEYNSPLNDLMKFVESIDEFPSDTAIRQFQKDTLHNELKDSSTEVIIHPDTTPTNYQEILNAQAPKKFNSRNVDQKFT